MGRAAFLSRLVFHCNETEDGELREYITKVGVSKNRKHTIAKHARRIVPSTKWTKEMDAVRWQNKEDMIQGDVALLIETPKSRKIDPSNFIEFFQDAFQTIWYDDDRVVRGGVWYAGNTDRFVIRAKPLSANFPLFISNAYEGS